MGGCRASLGALFGLIVLAAPIVALAQGGPVPLIPGLRGGAAPASDQRPAEGQPSGAVPEGVQIERLGAVDSAGLGLLRETDGGLPRSFWQGTDRAQIDRLVAAIQPTPSPAALNLARRLLLSEADMPPADGGQSGLFASRIERLTAIGDPDSAFRLARLAPGSMATMRTVDAAFLADRPQDACATLPSIPDSGRDAAWSKAFAFCRALAKDLAGANLQAGLLRERGEADPAFQALIAQLSGYGDDKLIDIKSPTPLQIAMLKAANKAPTGATVEAMPPAGARLVAEIAKVPAEIRWLAAERAFVYGAMPVEALRTAYGREEIAAKDLAAALAARTADNARFRAALFRAVQRAAEGERSKVLSTALERLRAREGGLDTRLAMVHLDALLGIDPVPEAIGLAPKAARLLLVAGQEAAADGWEQLLRLEGRGGALQAAREAVRLVPLLAVAAGERLEPADLRDWIDAWRAGGPIEGFEGRAVALLSALQGLGREVPPDVWGRLAAAGGTTVGRRPNVATMQAMRASAQAGRMGETIAYALIALGGDSAAALEADALATVLDSLVRIGFEREARRLALEAAIGRGL
ncbi:hypothetical protein [Desertibaculum subflavum]|uniref:hypothetical protein n=1 Tax=Desertibaculum subflavum TaxID=2268458 RepID=UPI000E66AA88